MKHTIYLAWFMAVFCFSHPLTAQTENGRAEKSEEKNARVKVNIEKPYNIKKNRKLAERMLEQGNIYGAIDKFLEILENDPDNTAVQYSLAEAYMAARDYKNAAVYYGKVVESQALGYELAPYKQALMLKMTERYEEAKPIFEEVRRRYKGDNSSTIKRWAKIEADGCDFGIQAKNNPVPVKIEHLPPEVNSPYSDFAPLLFDENTLVYTSLPTDTVIVLKDNSTHHFLKLYQSKITNGKYSKGEVLDKFNVPDAHTANGALSPDKQRFYFTVCNEDEINKPRCKIYMSKKVDGVWQPAEELTTVNDPKATNTHPTIGTYKNGMEILYFVSDRDGGRGGLDIWYSLITKTGEHKTPYNAGSRINTDRDEYSPYYDNETGTLYFSSNGHIGMGGFDVFRTEGEMRKWQKPENLGYPVNSGADDMYYILTKGQSEGYFVSNRPGVIAFKNETCCDDIFKFQYQKLITVAVHGYVFDKDKPDEPINGAEVKLSLTGSESGKDIVINVDTTENNLMYFFKLQVEKDYKISASKKGYLANSVTITTKGITESDTLRADIYLRKYEKGKAYRLKNIYYDYDKWFLREEAKKTLDTLYNIMMENPTIIVEIGSHTDQRGTDTYNANLSQKRAESCVNYLISKGIPKERLVAKGYGESQLLEDCTKVPECPQDGVSDCECHQRNRRTEFKIIGELDAELIYEDVRYEDVKESKTGKRKN